jgi:hypothetical protein
MPRSRSRAAEEDDDRPRRRRREEDNEGEDRPNRRGRPRRRRISPAKILGISIAVFAFAVVAVVVVLLVSRDTNKPAGSDLLAYVPSDAVVLTGFDVVQLSEYEPYRKALDRRAPPDLVELDKSGVRTADIGRVVFARTANNGNACVIRFRAGPDRSRYLGADVAGQNFAPFTSLTGSYKFGYFPDPSTLVLADTESTIQAVLDKGPKIQLPSDLKAMVDKAHGPAWRASGRITEADRGRVGSADNGFSIRAGASAGTAAWIEPNGRLGSVRFVIDFDNPAQARAAVATFRGLLNQRKVELAESGLVVGPTGLEPGDFADARKGYDEAEVTDSGSRLTARVRLPAIEALRVIGSAGY